MHHAVDSFGKRQPIPRWPRIGYVQHFRWTLKAISYFTEQKRVCALSKINLFLYSIIWQACAIEDASFSFTVWFALLVVAIGCTYTYTLRLHM